MSHPGEPLKSEGENLTEIILFCFHYIVPWEDMTDIILYCSHYIVVSEDMTEIIVPCIVSWEWYDWNDIVLFPWYFVLRKKKRNTIFVAG